MDNTNLFYKIEDFAPLRSLSLSVTKRRRAPKPHQKREAEESVLESEIGGVFVVFVGGGDLRNVFFGGNFCVCLTAVTFRGGSKLIETICAHSLIFESVSSSYAIPHGL